MFEPRAMTVVTCAAAVATEGEIIIVMPRGGSGVEGNL